MSKAKKKKTRAPRPKPVSRVPVAVVPTIDDIRNMPRSLALPELWCKIETPVRVRFLEPMRADVASALPGERKRPAMLARVLDLGEQVQKDLALPLGLANVFACVPKGDYVGRTYKLTRHRRHARMNAAGFTVEEIPAAEGD